MFAHYLVVVCSFSSYLFVLHLLDIFLFSKCLLLLHCIQKLYIKFLLIVILGRSYVIDLKLSSLVYISVYSVIDGVTTDFSILLTFRADIRTEVPIFSIASGTTAETALAVKVGLPASLVYLRFKNIASN